MRTLRTISQLLLLFLFLTSCSKNNDTKTTNTTFLSTQAGTKWLWTEDEDNNEIIDSRWYLKFLNNEQKPIEEWSEWQNHGPTDSWCYYKNEYTDALFIEILMNIDESFTMKITWSEKHIQYNKYTISENKMRLEINGTEAIGGNAESDYSGTYYFDRINNIPDNLKLCN